MWRVGGGCQGRLLRRGVAMRCSRVRKERWGGWGGQDGSVFIAWVLKDSFACITLSGMWCSWVLCWAATRQSCVPGSQAEVKAQLAGIAYRKNKASRALSPPASMGCGCRTAF